MRHPLRILSRVLMLLSLLAGPAGATLAADLATPSPPSVVQEPTTIPFGWELRFVPYGWLLSMNGT
jgi:hypothetical protein